jgi:sulfofructose kinase
LVLKNNISVLSLGNAALDVLTVVDRLPLPDEKLLTDNVLIDAGGPAATAAATVVRLGVEVKLAAVIGDDSVGDIIYDLNQRDGIDTSLIVRQTGRTSPISMVVANQGHYRAIIWSLGNTLPYQSSQEIIKASETSGVLLLDGKEMACGRELARNRRKQGALTMLDAGTLREGMLDLISECQLVAMSHKFATQLLAEFNPALALERVLAMGVEYAIVTVGADGCWGMGPDGLLLHQPAFPIKVVDSTGAGDIFHGAWAAAILKGMDWQEQLRYASGAAALGCRFPGGRKGIPTWQELESFIQQYQEIMPVKVK